MFNSVGTPTSHKHIPCTNTHTHTCTHTSLSDVHTHTHTHVHTLLSQMYTYITALYGQSCTRHFISLLDTSPQQRCPHCHDHQLDPLGHHAVTCKGGGDAVIRHNALRDVFAQFCHRARLGGQLEVGYGSGGDVSNSRPADFLVPNWTLGKPATFDLTVVSPLNSNTLIEAGATSGSAAGKAEVRKHNTLSAGSCL